MRKFCWQEYCTGSGPSLPAKLRPAVESAALSGVPPEAAIALAINGGKVRGASAKVLTASTMDAHNDFDAPERLAPRDLTGIQVLDNTVKLKVPAKSVSILEVNP